LKFASFSRKRNLFLFGGITRRTVDLVMVLLYVLRIKFMTGDHALPARLENWLQMRLSRHLNRANQCASLDQFGMAMNA
jgi:hypothetical protein